MRVMEDVSDDKRGRHPQCLRRRPFATDPGTYPVCVANLGLRLRAEYDTWVKKDWRRKVFNCTSFILENFGLSSSFVLIVFLIRI